ncbi:MULTISPECIES: PadR family transcriptional regulator [Paenibacillus]|uniref:PadR family transcriptional regulator n=1 Tax=Paenibacillus TaxID=44249 RepID=UPI00096F4406|nr:MULTISPECIES: PadR family transcriptional regulator [Paenibacillus]MCP3743112.1 PadR family transcriptional regulator [Paenibacillus sp. A3M_27_13]OMF31462.1 transcriptional regulator [Paenibacillus peoriae]
MNLLSYGLLGLLAREESSGYDLMLRIQPFWQAKHSQIYPLLARMEGKELLASRWIQQSDKPDKKMYTITDKGIHMLQQWSQEALAAPVTRDELSLRLFCLWLTDKSSANRMLEERKRHFIQKIQHLEDILNNIPAENLHFGSKNFGDYILVQKGLLNAKAGLEWCQMVLRMLLAGDVSVDTNPFALKPQS